MKIKFGAVVAIFIMAVGVWQECFPSTEWGREQDTRGNRLNVERDEKVRLLNGEMIGRGLVLYAEDHNGALPTNLQSLVPGYVGTNILVGSFRLSHPGEKVVCVKFSKMVGVITASIEFFS